MIYDVKVRPDIVIRVEADNEDQATQKAFAELEKTEGSKIYDKAFFDYDTGVKSTKLRSLLGIAEGRDQAGKEIEKEAVLQKYAGSTGFAYDSAGNLAITPEGQRTLAEKNLFDKNLFSNKNIVIDEKGFSSGDFADFSGIAGPVFGAIAALSPHLRVASVLRSLIGSQRIANILASGIGTAGGKAAEEAYESSSDLQRQSKEEIAGLLKSEFIFGAGAQTIGELFGAGFSAFFGSKSPADKLRDGYVIAKGYAMDDVLKLDQKLGKEATVQQIEKAVKTGEIATLDAKGAVSMQFLGRAIPGRMQGIGETIAGRQTREQGLIDYNNAMLAKLREKLTEKEIAYKRYAEIGDLGLPAKEVKMAKDRLKIAEKEANDFVNKMLGDLSSETGGFGPVMQALDKSELGMSVQNTLKEAYKDVIKTHQRKYAGIDARIDKLEGDVLDRFKQELSADLKGVGEFINERLGKIDPLLKYNEDDVGLSIIQGLQKEIESGVFKDGVSLTQLRKIEEALKGVKAVQGLKSRGQAGNFYDDVEKMVTDIIERAPETFMYTAFKSPKGFQGALPRGVPYDKKVIGGIVDDLRVEQARYREIIEPFNNARVQKIKTQAQGQGVDPSDVYEYIMKPNRGGDMKAVLSALERKDPTIAFSLKSNLTRRLFKDTLDTATDPVTGIVNMQKYTDNILKYNSTLEALLGPNYSKMVSTLEQVRKYSPRLNENQVRSLVNEIKATNVGQGTTFNRFLNSLEDKAKASGESIDLEKSALMRNIENSAPETIVKTIFRPNSAREINQARNVLSQEAFDNVKEEALEQLLRKGVTPGVSDLSEIFKPNVFQRALDSYGPETLEAMFGKDMALSLRGFARSMSSSVAGAEKAGAGSIVAGTLAANFFNLNLLPSVVSLTIYKTIFGQPMVVAALAKTDKGSIATVLSAFSRAARIAGVTELREGTQKGVEAVIKEGERTGITDEVSDEFKDFADQLPTQAPSLDLALPDVAYTSDQINTAPIGPTLLPNPRDQEIAELLRRV